MKETTFRKKFKRQEINFDNDMDDAVDTTYQFSAAPVFKSSVNKDSSVILVASHNHKESDSIDFLLKRDDCEKLIKYLQGVVDYIDERNEIISNLEERFALIREAYKNEEIDDVSVSLCDENPLGMNTEFNKPCLLKFEPNASITCIKFFTAFYAIMYVTGIYDMDKKVFKEVLDGIPLVYDSALKKRGERIRKEQMKSAMKAMDERTERLKQQIKK